MSYNSIADRQLVHLYWRDDLGLSMGRWFFSLVEEANIEARKI